MAYIVDAGRDSAFEFAIGDREYSVTAATRLPMAQLMDYGDALAQGSDAAMRWLYSFFCASCPEVADLPADSFADLAAAWRNGTGGDSLGESSASSG